MVTEQYAHDAYQRVVFVDNPSVAAAIISSVALLTAVILSLDRVQVDTKQKVCLTLSVNWLLIVIGVFNSVPTLGHGYTEINFSRPTGFCVYLASAFGLSISALRHLRQLRRDSARGVRFTVYLTAFSIAAFILLLGTNGVTAVEDATPLLSNRIWFALLVALIVCPPLWVIFKPLPKATSR